MKKILLLVFCIMALGLSGCGGDTISNNADIGRSEKAGEKNEEVNIQTKEENSAKGVSEDSLSATMKKTIEVGDATLFLPDNYGYSEYTDGESDYSTTSYGMYLEPDSTSNYLMVNYYRNRLDGEWPAEEAKALVTNKLYPEWKNTLDYQFPEATLIKEEPFTKDNDPSYHYVISSVSSGIEYMHDIYLFMANSHDLLVVDKVHSVESKNDYSEEYIEMINSIKLAGIHDDVIESSSKADSSTNSSGSFTNKYGTPTTKCAHTGCNNYIAPSGDTNCCTVHSNRCADCGKYIDEDAMYCMDCLYKASGQSTGNGANSNIGSGGYEMPNENDKSFSDYVKRVDPDLYDELFSE